MLHNRRKCTSSHHYLWMLLLVTLGLAVSERAQAAHVKCRAGDVTCLIGAIDRANRDHKPAIIVLTRGTYTLTTVNNMADNAPNGLPSITTSVFITGVSAAATILERSATAPPFRIFHIAPLGALIVQGITVRGGDTFHIPDSDLVKGGALRNQGMAIIQRSIFIGNSASWGGALANEAKMIVHGSTFSDNAAGDRLVPAGGLEGGAIYNNGQLIIRDSSIFGNIARFMGGGVANEIGSLTIVNTTVAGNTTHRREEEGTKGAGIFNTGTLTILNSTISGNSTGGTGGGIANDDFYGGAMVTLQNTIVAKNEGDLGGPDCQGSIQSLGNNVIGDESGCTITLVSSDRIGDPGLGTFVDNGDPGNGHLPLLASSQGIDAANAAVCPRRDQLGQLRVDGDDDGSHVCDIGAIEFYPKVFRRR